MEGNTLERCVTLPSTLVRSIRLYDERGWKQPLGGERGSVDWAVLGAVGSGREGKARGPNKGADLLPWCIVSQVLNILLLTVYFD